MNVFSRETGEEGDPLRSNGGDEGTPMREGQKTFTARRLRKEETLAEKRLWEQLRNRTLGGYKFVRQAPIGPFIADFLCREVKLVVEIDGWTHSTPEEIGYDEKRTGFLARDGYRVIRFENVEILDGMDGVLAALLEELKK